MKLTIMLALFTAVLTASPIANLNNTGLAPQQTVDPNWTINGGSAYVTLCGPAVFPCNFWIPDTASSSWISPQPSYAGGFGADPGGLYDFSTTFTLAADFDPAMTRIGFLAASDNYLVDVKINGVSIGATLPALSFVFDPSTIISSGFVAGINQLDFMVQNLPLPVGDPVGLQVQFTSETEAETPEPVVEILVGSGLILLLVRKRKARS